jgi:hypothetical protein
VELVQDCTHRQVLVLIMLNLQVLLLEHELVVESVMPSIRGIINIHCFGSWLYSCLLLISWHTDRFFYSFFFILVALFW